MPQSLDSGSAAEMTSPDTAASGQRKTCFDSRRGVFTIPERDTYPEEPLEVITPNVPACVSYQPSADDMLIAGSLFQGWPVDHVRRYGLSHEATYGDGWHFCCEARAGLRLSVLLTESVLNRVVRADLEGGRPIGHVDRRRAQQLKPIALRSF